MSKEIIDVTEKSRNIYFDTSIYNRLLVDPQKTEILKLIKEKNLIVIPSVVNLCELLMTSSPDLKTELINIYDEIRNDFHPLKPFTWLLKEAVETVQKGDDEWEICYPISITDETENICRDLISQKGVELEPYLKDARDHIQKVLKKNLADESQYFAYFDGENGQNILLKLFDGICKSISPVCRLDEGSKLDIIRSPSMPWKYYLESYAYLFYRRAFLNTQYGKPSNPSPSDLEQCVYLFWTGKFVVEDVNFLKFLKRLKAIKNYEVEIMDYADFKHFLFKSDI